MCFCLCSRDAGHGGGRSLGWRIGAARQRLCLRVFLFPHYMRVRMAMRARLPARRIRASSAHRGDARFDRFASVRAHACVPTVSVARGVGGHARVRSRSRATVHGGRSTLRKLTTSERPANDDSRGTKARAARTSSSKPQAARPLLDGSCSCSRLLCGCWSSRALVSCVTAFSFGAKEQSDVNERRSNPREKMSGLSLVPSSMLWTSARCRSKSSGSCCLRC